MSHQGVNRRIRTRHAVKQVDFCESSKKFTVSVKDLESKEVRSETFDVVINASGLFAIPNKTEIPGMSGFTGTCLHIKELR